MVERVIDDMSDKISHWNYEDIMRQMPFQNTAIATRDARAGADGYAAAIDEFCQMMGWTDE